MKKEQLDINQKQYDLSDISQQAIVEYPVSQDFIERVLEGKFSESHSFEDTYRGLANYKRKYAVASALINDGRYARPLALRLYEDFVRSEEPVKLEEQGLLYDLRLQLIEKGLVKPKKEEQDFKRFVDEVAEGDSLNAQDFRRLISLFGSSKVVDLLYRYRPEYRGLPVENVKSILGEYLGEFLTIRGELRVDDIEAGLDYLSDPNLKEGLVEVVKDSCLSFYNQNRKAGVKSADLDIILGYIQSLETEVTRFNNSELTEVLQEVQSYYISAFEDFHRLDRLTDSLREGREFPDLNQRINIKEIADKRRVLIADEMGIGKSASAILAKESLGLGTALVITPSNVVNTWRSYLSDQVSIDGERIGYFKPGEAPKVLVIEDINSLKSTDITTYDYVIISQEKLREQYVDNLEGVNFDMLIVDEVHKLKNLEDGKRASSLLKLAKKIEGDNKYLALLSGTPVPNKIEDVAMLLKLLYPERFEQMTNKELVRKIIYGDAIDLRSLLLPRMQMKSLVESVEMPQILEEKVYVDLSPGERDIYEALLEEDEITATTKLTVLRQFLLNPEIFDLVPLGINSKIQAAGEKIRSLFANKNKVVMFVNGYIEGVIRGDKNILGKLGIPDDIEIRIIEGNVDTNTRVAIQADLNTSDKKILLIVSGQTADVGVDFSGGEAVLFYNEPWTKYDYKQQLARVYRPGLSADLECATLITRDTVEEGIHFYIEAKYRAIEKLLRGIPISDLERTLILKSEEQLDPNLEVNPELAKYYFSAWDKMMRKFFRYTREIGEEAFLKFLEKFGKEYADCYIDLGNRSYQSNAGRVTGSLIAEMVKEEQQDPASLRIIDIASGPEVLRKHISREYQDSIVSLDINEHHFQNPEGRTIVGSYTNLPFLDNSMDYANLSLALHYSDFAPSREEFERLKVLTEMNRVLKVGGKAVINIVYSLHLKDEEKFKNLVSKLGFEIVEEYTGQVVAENYYKSQVYTLRKSKSVSHNIEEIAFQIDKTDWKGLKFSGTGAKVKESRRIITEFSVNGRKLAINFNPQDKELLEEERGVMKIGEQLKGKYGKIQEIPKEEIVNNGFVRFYNGKRYLLFKKLERGSGAVVIR